MANPSAETVGVPSGALAQMVWGLACQRAYGDPSGLPIACLKRRSEVRPRITIGSANEFYYAIIDCIAVGHRWRAEKEFNSCGRCHEVKANRDFKPGEFHRGR